jgi:hypothetical protein
MIRGTLRGLFVLVLSLGATGVTLAWGPTGQEWVSGIAIEKLPDAVPGFVRTPEAAAEIALMGREPDRWRSADKTHDAERDPGRYIKVADDGEVMGVVALGQLPMTREEYDTLLRAKGFTQNRAGYLPYSIIDGWQQLKRDLAYWRADVKGIETAANAQERAWFEADRKLREKLTLRDIGIWSHYVGDASQPLHVTVHFDGWDKYPNPDGYPAKPIHAYFEAEFMKANLSRQAVAKQVGPYADCRCSIEQRTESVLRASLAAVGPLYQLDKQGGFGRGDARGISFATARLAAGATALRDMIVDAWVDSANADVGYPPVNVRDIESGKIRVTPDQFSSD